MANEVPQNAVSASLASIEANVVIAGVEAAIGIWVIFAVLTEQCVIPDVADKWHWAFAFYAVLGFLGVIVAGFALEAAAGLIERIISRPLWGRNTETAWKWYRTFTKQPDLQHAAKAQKWIWKSPQAYQEFSRRRLRILVARNTSIFLLLFSVFWLLVVSWSLWLLVGLFGAVMFAWLWLDAQKAWNLAVNMTDQLGEP